MTLYLKYRPQTLADLDSQEAREALKRIVASGKIPQAILFSGPKGIGKTSAARILAKILNCERLASSKPATRSYKLEANYEPCNKCEQCISITNGNNLDVIEIDAASHRGIDDIRSLKEGVKLATFGGKKKVYIIDEAHMLTLEASNALLKTLEEPPEHVTFILATTNPEKLIETIKSRTRIVEFGKAKVEEIIRQLTRIVKGERIKAEDGVLDLIAGRADGSFRDAVKLLEELSLTSKDLKQKSVAEYLLSLKFFNLDDFFPLLANKKSKEALECLEKASQKAISMRSLCDRIVEKLKDSLLSLWALPGETLPGFSSDEHLTLIDLFLNARSQIGASPIAQLPLELAVLKFCQPKLNELNQIDLAKDEVKDEDLGNSNKVDTQKDSAVSQETWGKILREVKPRNTSVEALLRAARPVGFDGGILTLGVFYKFHKERLEKKEYRDILEEVSQNVMGTPVRVICTLTEPPQKPAVTQEKDNNILPPSDAVLTEPKDEDIIKAAKEIFDS